MKLHLLAIAAHPDDVELSCAGTLIKHARKGQATGILDLTQGELGTRGTAATRAAEAAEAAKIMGVSVRENLKLADGFFQNDVESQLAIIRYIRKYKPEIVIANALEDRHPDHRKGGRLIADACFYAGLRKIVTVWDGQEQEAWRPKRVFHMIQDRISLPTFVVDVSEYHSVKMEAIQAYKTQFHDPNSNEPMTYISSSGFLNNIINRDQVMGKMIGSAYGEGYISENVPGISDLDQLKLPEMP